MSTITQEELGRRLQAARKAVGMTQEEVAQRLHIPRSAVALIEGGKRKVSSFELEKLARLYLRDLGDFLKTEPQVSPPLAVLFRKAPELAKDDDTREALTLAFELAREMRGLQDLLRDPDPGCLAPRYELDPPGNRKAAVEQGEEVAEKERARLQLGSQPIKDLTAVLKEQGVVVVEADLPERVSGLSVFDRARSVLVVVNRSLPGHSAVRRRFSLAHEYAHVLLDREQQAIVSFEKDTDLEGRGRLLEVRANAFAASFLLPRDGVRHYLRRLAIRAPRRRSRPPFPPEEDEGAVKSYPYPSGLSCGMKEVVWLAGEYGVSRMCAIYRLRNLGYLSRSQFESLLEAEETGEGKQIEQEWKVIMGLESEDLRRSRSPQKLTVPDRLLQLAITAYEREQITRAKLSEIFRLAGIEPSQLSWNRMGVHPRIQGPPHRTSSGGLLLPDSAGGGQVGPGGFA